MKMLEVTMPDGSKWRVEASIIAKHRATSYENKWPADTTYKREYDFAMGSDYELMDWAANNMNWSDVVRDARTYRLPSAPDYKEGWLSGPKRIVNL